MIRGLLNPDEKAVHIVLEIAKILELFVGRQPNF
jgi:hypothetical protein